MLGGLVVLAGLALARFVVPPEEVRKSAIGRLDGLNPALRRAFSDHGEFQPKVEPGPSDWLAQHKEPGQTFAQFTRSRANKPGGARNTLYILPLGGFGKGQAPELTALQEYAAIYFQPLEVRMLEAIAEARIRTAPRLNEQSGQWQINSRQVLAWMKSRVPRDAYAMIAVTMSDLYPEDSWNFVFGQASLRDRVGVFSFARYHPSFYKGKAGEGSEQLVLLRALKVLVHESGHMFGIRHCVHYQCLMNGANHLGETDASPIHLCPVCLRKLHHALGFDPAERYRKLRGFYQEKGLMPEEQWVEKRLRLVAPAR